MNKAEIRFRHIGAWVETKPWAFRGVALLSFLWLVIGVPFLSLYQDGVRPFFSPVNKGNQDLANYYMAGSIVIEGAFDSLYPVPRENIRHNAGWPDCSDSKPGYVELAQRKGVEDSFRFILPPPSALLFVPLGLIPYPAGRWVWVIFLGFCCWGTCLLASHTARRCGCSQGTSLFLFAVWAFSPLILKALRTANSTPLLAFSIGLAALGIFENRRACAVTACIAAALLKGTSIIFVPLILLMRRWGIVFWGGVFTILINGITLALGGGPAYAEFFEKIYPTTQMISPYMDNQSVFGFFYRLFGESVLDPEVTLIVKSAGALCILSMTLLVLIRRKGLQQNRIQFFSAAAALLGMHLVFRPYNWSHYALCYVPFWGALLAGLKSRAGRIALWISMALQWCPLLVFHGKQVMKTEPFSSHILAGQLLLIALAAVVFIKQPNQTGF
jgi:hypothetical protein